MNTLPFQTARTFLIGAIALGVLLFLPAWTLAYWQAWVFIVVFMISVNVIGVYLTLKDPALLERRKKIGPGEEQSTMQKIIMFLAILTTLALLVFCAFDHRFAWSPVPSSVSVLGDALVALGLLIGIPLALGSWWGLAILVITIPVLMVRILDEEKLLSKDLPGYRDYTQKVRYRLMPYLW